MPGDFQKKKKRKNKTGVHELRLPFHDRESCTRPDQIVYPCCVCERGVCLVSKTCTEQHDHMVALTGMTLQGRCSDVNDVERGFEKLC